MTGCSETLGSDEGCGHTPPPYLFAQSLPKIALSFGPRHAKVAEYRGYSVYELWFALLSV